MTKSLRERWKRCERRIASYIGGERVPVTGRQRGSAPDIEHPWLAVEVKYREAGIPQWVDEALAQADASKRLCQPPQGATRDAHQLPVAILCGKGETAGEARVVMRLEDFREWFL